MIQSQDLECDDEFSCDKETTRRTFLKDTAKLGVKALPATALMLGAATVPKAHAATYFVVCESDSADVASVRGDGTRSFLGKMIDNFFLLLARRRPIATGSCIMTIRG